MECMGRKEAGRPRRGESAAGRVALEVRFFSGAYVCSTPLPSPDPAYLRVTQGEDEEY